MNLPRSLQRRLLLALGVLLTLLWLGTAAITALLVRHAMEEVFDAGLQETAQRILPLAVADVLEREDDGVIQRLAEVREHDELLAYIADEGVEIVDIRFCDLPGIMQHFTVPAGSFDQSVFEDGLAFDGSSIRGFQKIHESDMARRASTWWRDRTSKA